MWKNKAALGVLVLASLIGHAACSGDDGKDGATGDTGAKGEPGEPGKAGEEGPAGKDGADGADGVDGENGAQGEPGTAPEGSLTTSCLGPCHGFNGLVEQWKSSRHFSTYIANLGGDEAETWTGQSACGNCHAIDGIEQRLAGNVKVAGAGSVVPAEVEHGQINYKNAANSAIAESSYLGQATVAVVHCSTCHDTSAANDPHLTGDVYTPGSFPLRVPSAATDYAVIEKSSAVGTSDGTKVNYGKGNACIWCHKSRKDVTNYLVDGAKVTSAYWGPHEGPHADVFTGKGAYEFPGKTYDPGTHQTLENGCISCHMPTSEENSGVGNHSFWPKDSACTQCHAQPAVTAATGLTNLQTKLRLLRKALAGLGLLSKDGVTPMDPNAMPTDSDFAHDVAMPDKVTVRTLAQQGALYDYFLFARGGGNGAHNPKYSSQVLYDALQTLGVDVSLLTR